MPFRLANQFPQSRISRVLQCFLDSTKVCLKYSLAINETMYRIPQRDSTLLRSVKSRNAKIVTITLPGAGRAGKDRLGRPMNAAA